MSIYVLKKPIKVKNSLFAYLLKTVFFSLVAKYFTSQMNFFFKFLEAILKIKNVYITSFYKQFVTTKIVY